jgi:hypothetical protein
VRGGPIDGSRAPHSLGRTAEARRPLFWAGFVVSGASTSLPSFSEEIDDDEPPSADGTAKVVATAKVDQAQGVVRVAGVAKVDATAGRTRKFEEWSVEEVASLLTSCGYPEP